MAAAVRVKPCFVGKSPLLRAALCLFALAMFYSPEEALCQQSSNITYTYDKLNRLTAVVYSGGAAVVYTYDAAGNRMTLQVTGGRSLPVIASLSPSTAVTGGQAFVLTVNGQNFVNGAVVRWAGSNRPTTFVSSTRLTANIPAVDIAAAGSVNVTVSDPLGGLSNAVGFTVSPQPRIDAVTPRAGRSSGGQQVKLNGYFANMSGVRVGGVAATVVSSSETQVVITTPAHAVGPVTIELLTASGGTYSKQNCFAFLPTSFTDNVLVPEVTMAKGQHIIELRQAVDALRVVAGLAPAVWTDPTLSPSSSIVKAAHVRELRANLEDAAGRLGYAPAAYTDPSLGAGSVIKRIHIEELRHRIRTLAG